MVGLIDSNGLRLNLVKLNGKLELRFAKDASFTAQCACHGTEIEDTVVMEYAREAAAGQSVVSLGLEMFMENVEGYLEVRYEGVLGSTLSFHYDGRDFDDLPTVDEALQAGPHAVRGGQTQTATNILSFGAHDFQQRQATTQDVKVQTTDPDTRNAKMQTVGAPVVNVGAQTKTKHMISRSVQVSMAKILSKSEVNLSQTIVDLTHHDELMPASSLADPGSAQRPPEAVQTFTNAVVLVFQAFNEPQDPNRKKRQAEPAADYRAYKHIFIEGYRNGDDKEEEGRLHINLAYHILLWESYDDYDGEIIHKPLRTSHYFGDYQLSLYRKKARRSVFCIDHRSKDAKIFINTMGNGDERFHFVGEDRALVVTGAIEECLSFKAEYGAPTME